MDKQRLRDYSERDVYIKEVSKAPRSLLDVLRPCHESAFVHRLVFRRVSVFAHHAGAAPCIGAAAAAPILLHLVQQPGSTSLIPSHCHTIQTEYVCPARPHVTAAPSGRGAHYLPRDQVPQQHRHTPQRRLHVMVCARLSIDPAQQRTGSSLCRAPHSPALTTCLMNPTPTRDGYLVTCG